MPYASGLSSGGTRTRSWVWLAGLAACQIRAASRTIAAMNGSMSSSAMGPYDGQALSDSQADYEQDSQPAWDALAAPQSNPMTTGATNSLRK